jgi:hypothetical protein
VARGLKEIKETRESEAWAGNQIARVLDHVPPETALTLIFREMGCRGMPIPRPAKSLLKFLKEWNLEP